MSNSDEKSAEVAEIADPSNPPSETSSTLDLGEVDIHQLSLSQFSGSSAINISPNIENSSPSIWNSSPHIENTSSEIANSSPETGNSSPEFVNSSPKIAYSSPKTAYSSPKTEYSSPHTEYSSPNIWNKSPNIRNSSTNSNSNDSLNENEGLNERGIKEKSEEISDQIISIFVDKKLLEKTNMDSYKPIEDYMKKELVEFELYAQENKDDIEGAYGYSTEDLQMTISVQKVTNGYILNSSVFLPNNNYNCIINHYCIICDEKCIDEHVNDEIHSRKIKEIMPLEKYDMSIIRKINGMFHCGVCNETIELNITLHFESKNHENNLLFAINKASDIMYDCDVHKDKEDGYHFNVNTIVENGNYFTDSTKNKHSYTDYINNDIDYDNHRVNYNNNRVNYDNDHFNYDNTPNDPDNDYSNNPQGSSYASMAKTPKIEKPIYITVVVNNVTVKVKFDCYHMVIGIGVNQFYCMICKVTDIIRLKAEHCTGTEHLNKMKGWTIVDEYSDFFVRKHVDDSFYHCGLCNNLQFKSDLNDHLEFRHQKELDNHHNAKTQNSTKTNIPNKQNYNHNASGNLSRIIDNSAANDNSLTNLSEKDETKIKLYKNDVEKGQILRPVSLCIFKENIITTLLNYFVVLPDESPKVSYNCGLCHIPLNRPYILDHVVEKEHLKLLNESPFIQSLGFNLIRLLHNNFYCTLCNKIIHKTNLNEHLKDITHDVLKNELFTNDFDPIALTVKQNDIPITNIYDEYVKSVVDDIILEKAFNKKPEEIDITEEDEETDNSEVNLSVESIQETFNFDEKMYLKTKNSYANIYTLSYHSLIPIDNRRFCFSCDEIVYFEIATHIESRPHVENLKKLHFINNYGSHLIRQLFLMYHCAICNVIIPKSNLGKHINGTIHTNLRTDAIIKKLPPNSDFIEIPTQKEEIYLKQTEKRSKISFSAIIVPKKTDENIVKLNKLVFIKDSIVKLNWDSYNSIVTLKEEFQCLLCQMSFVDSLTHVKSSEHTEVLANNEFISKFGVNLIRKIDSANVNCAICNTQLNDSSAMIDEHLRGKKHVTNLEKIIKTSSETDKYDDCHSEAIFV